ncbi:hypothetical protein BD410DRAFT_472119 [Rickenella mellea]|uniref:G protein-coupled receptor 89 n=1 Tax=Rickenella mellea TaxID=50990 RepID=A0A4Y7QHL4_9AGAM|nr:hypothetical protein BD410DRAFT_472119 [Rickenella mellea]
MSKFTVVLETIIITLGVRAPLFFGCRKFLLKPLYTDLRNIAAPTGVEEHERREDISDSNDFALEVLPTVSSNTSTSGPKHDVQAAPMKAMGRYFHENVAQMSFALCFSESCVLFAMIVCQGSGILSHGARILNWHISMTCLLVMILFVIPLSQIYLLTGRSSHMDGVRTERRKAPLLWRLFLTGAPYTICLLSFSYVPVPQGLNSADKLYTLLSRLIVIGTIILGLLSGFGAIRNAWDFFPVFSGSRKLEPTEQDVTSAEHALTRVRDDLLQRRLERDRREAATPKSGTSWLSNVVPSFRGNAEANALQREIDGLEALEYQMDRSLDVLKARRANALFSRTLRGKLTNWAGRLFAIYCIFRIISCILNIVTPMRDTDPSKSTPSTTTYPDIITHLLAYLVSLLPSMELTVDDISAISREISLGLVGVIIISSFRVLLRGVSRVVRLSSRNLGASLMLLVVAQLMGIYFLTTIVQLRTAFPLPAEPPDSAATPSNLFSTLPQFEVFGSLFDWSFILATTFSAVIRWVDARINGVD